MLFGGGYHVNAPASVAAGIVAVQSYPHNQNTWRVVLVERTLTPSKWQARAVARCAGSGS